uniref:tRNA (guanine(9)-N(1))-methyltransferase n=1 Tax=Zea mays TaxID=4577 RepID=A0A804U9Y7_MAIZE
MGHNAGRTPLIDISNTSVTGDQIGSNSLGPIDDANERKRQRDRERYATMSIEQKNEKNRKHREARQRNTGLPLKSESSRGPIKNTPLAGNSIERKRQRDRERRATMSVEQRNEYNNKRRQMRRRNKGQNVMPDVSGDGDNKVNVDLDDDSDWLHRNETFQTNNYVATTDLLSPDAETVLDDLDMSKIYIIGGLVDRNRWKGITLKKSAEQGIQSAKLPIGNYLKMSSSQVLTVNQVFEIMLKFVETRDWKTAFFHVIPQRKRGEAETGD